MKKIGFLFVTFCLSLNGLENASPQKVVIVGGGIIGALESYYAYLDAVQNQVPTQIMIYEKSPPFAEGACTNTAFHICPSLTPDEILSVVPRGSELVEKLGYLFNERDGIRVDDVPHANDSPQALQFKEAVEVYGHDPKHEDRTRKLLRLGKLSMDLWQEIYDRADPELQSIFDQSNFNPCHEPKNKAHRQLHDGYRIDLIYEVESAESRAQGMRSTYVELGYADCKLLSPEEVMKMDPALASFCMEHSSINEREERIWKEDAAALWRPGGSLAALDFLPLFYPYMKKRMGTFVDASGQTQNCFQIEFNKEVVGMKLDDGARIAGLQFRDGSFVQEDPENCRYVLCPGEAVGTLRKFGLDEPVYAGFAGPAIILHIPISPEQKEIYKDFNHCMEVHKVGIVMAWQARRKENELILQASGTKAFYGDQIPTNEDAFAIDRHLVQLNMMNNVLPEMISIAFGRSTKGIKLSFEDLEELEEKGILVRWVGRRAVAYDGFPTLGALYFEGQKVKNGRCTTHMGSGGVAFAPGAVEISRQFEERKDLFAEEILHYADSRREARR